MPFTPNKAGWDQLAKEIVNEHIEPAMKRLAQRCNTIEGIDDGYRSGEEGPGTHLAQHDYRSTVITATAEAQALNAEHNTLEREFYSVGGDL